MPEDKVVKQGNGIVEKKEETATHKGKPYWKFVIGGNTYSLFEYDAGKGIKVRDKVGMYWTETQKGEITYRNLNSIFLEDGTSPVEEEVVGDSKEQPKNYEEAKNKDMEKVRQFKEKDADKYELGMAKNNAAIIIAQKFSSKDTPWEEGWGKAYWDLVNKLYSKGKELRKELLGY